MTSFQSFPLTSIMSQVLVKEELCKSSCFRVLLTLRPGHVHCFFFFTMKLARNQSIEEQIILYIRYDVMTYIYLCNLISHKQEITGYGARFLSQSQRDKSWDTGAAASISQTFSCTVGSIFDKSKICMDRLQRTI